MTLTTELIEEKLRTVLDPELGINIVDLGLIYGIDFDEEGNVEITMTMTSPMCPLIPTIERDTKQALEGLPEVIDVHVEIVWEPAWTPEKMSQEAKLQLGMGGIT